MALSQARRHAQPATPLGRIPSSHIPLSRADAERDGGSTDASTFPRQSSESGFAAHQRHWKKMLEHHAPVPRTHRVCPSAKACSAIMPTQRRRLRDKKQPLLHVPLLAILRKAAFVTTAAAAAAAGDSISAPPAPPRVSLLWPDASTKKNKRLGAPSAHTWRRVSTIAGLTFLRWWICAVARTYTSRYCSRF